MLLSVKNFYSKSIKFGIKNPTPEIDNHSLVKKIIYLVLKIILVPFKLIQGTYSKLFTKGKQKSIFTHKIFEKLDCVSSFFKKNKSTIIKTTLVAALTGLLVFGYSVSNLSRPVNNLSQNSQSFNNLELKESFLPFCAILVYLSIWGNKIPEYESDEVVISS